MYGSVVASERSRKPNAICRTLIGNELGDGRCLMQSPSKRSTFMVSVMEKLTMAMTRECGSGGAMVLQNEQATIYRCMHRRWIAWCFSVVAVVWRSDLRWRT